MSQTEHYNLHLVSFADKRFASSAARLKQQALNFDCFKSINIYDEETIPTHIKQTFATQLNSNVRGFGYWCWKPAIILEVLDGIPEGDIVLYLDAGCHLNSAGMPRFEDYCKAAVQSKTGVLGFSYDDPDPSLGLPKQQGPNHAIRNWCKADLVAYFDLTVDSQLLDQKLIIAGITFYRKCSSAVAILRRWQQVFEYDFHLVDDSPSNLPNYPGFIEHRHDQAAFSIICREEGVDCLSAFEHDFRDPVSNQIDTKMLKGFPIHALRDLRSSTQEKSLKTKFKRLFNRVLSVLPKRLRI